MTTSDTGWYKSSFSAAGNSTCVEVRMTGGAVYIRDTKNREGGMLHVGQSAWSAFVHMSAAK